jgi:hypothetical protein
MSGLHRLGTPHRTTVHAGPGGIPTTVGRAHVESVNEDWVVEDRWWTGRLLRRRYFELVMSDGRNVVVFLDLETGRWFNQRG